MEDGDLVIFDVGCELDHYVSDVGRTFPVSGRFTPEQRRALELSTSVSDAIIAAVRPGVTLRDLQEVAERNIPNDQKRYMQTGLYFGHHIGLSTSAPVLTDEPLRPGMIFTVEPWYYNHDDQLSVFIEDVLLVTETGVEVLTTDLPRRPEELEKLVPGRSFPRIPSGA
jgi:Xaa-Pro aminopeptidase